MGRPLLLLTNDDGIDSVGLHVLARAMARHGEVLVVAPDGEYSGASASLGALHLIRPEVREVALDGVDRAYAVSGPPALCTMFAALGAFGAVPDLCVSGINPGANVGRAVYHSGTVGAALTARGRGFSGVAVSQEVSEFAVEGQGTENGLAGQRWDDAATVADVVVGGLLAAGLPDDPVVINVNVPNRPLSQMTGWRYGEVALRPPRAMANATLRPKPGHAGCYHVDMSWGDPIPLPSDTDAGLVESGRVAISYLSRLSHDQASQDTGIDRALDELLC